MLTLSSLRDLGALALILAATPSMAVGGGTARGRTQEVSGRALAESWQTDCVL